MSPSHRLRAPAVRSFRKKVIEKPRLCEKVLQVMPKLRMYLETLQTINQFFINQFVLPLLEMGFAILLVPAACALDRSRGRSGTRTEVLGSLMDQGEDINLNSWTRNSKDA